VTANGGRGQVSMSWGGSEFSGETFDANPSTGVSVYDSTPCQGMSGWMVFGGTSVSAPSLSGLINSAGGFYGDSQGQLLTAYSFLSSYGSTRQTPSFR
jgi:hypothetical protein